MRRAAQFILAISLLGLVAGAESWLAAVPEGTDELLIEIIQPAERGLAGRELKVVAAVTSRYQVQRVTAQVADQEMDLEFSERAYCGPPPRCMVFYPGWVGTLPLPDLARGEQQVTVKATDVFGGTAEARRVFILDEKPVLDIQAPIGETVARPQLRLNIQCTDDDPVGCVSTRVLVTAPDITVIATGQAEIDTTVSLAAYDGQQVTLRLEGTDSAGQVTAESRVVYVESSTRFAEVASVGGRILDVQSDRILFVETSEDSSALKILDRSTGEETLISVNPFASAFLTPGGVLFLEASGDGIYYDLYEWRDGASAYLASDAVALKVKGNYAIWVVQAREYPFENRLFRRDLVAGTNVEMEHRFVGNAFNDVAANGDVVYWTYRNPAAYNIFRYRDDITTQLTDDRELWNVYPKTDGIRVVYAKSPPCCADQRFEVFLYDDAGEMRLSPSLPPNIQRETAYQVNDGWITVLRPGTGGTVQVWVISPAGEERQATYFGTSSYIDALGPNGDVIFKNGNRLYWTDSGAPPIPIATNVNYGRRFHQDGQWFAILGRSLFQIDTDR